MKKDYFCTKFVILLRKKQSYLLSQILKADQPLIWFNMPESNTTEQACERSVQVKLTGVDKQQCTKILAVTGDGHKLPPFVIFTRVTLSKDTIPPGIIVRAQE
jgi:hypothetical protein